MMASQNEADSTVESEEAESASTESNPTNVRRERTPPPDRSVRSRRRVLLETPSDILRQDYLLPTGNEEHQAHNVLRERRSTTSAFVNTQTDCNTQVDLHESGAVRIVPRVQISSENTYVGTSNRSSEPPIHHSSARTVTEQQARTTSRPQQTFTQVRESRPTSLLVNETQQRVLFSTSPPRFRPGTVQFAQRVELHNGEVYILEHHDPDIRRDNHLPPVSMPHSHAPHGHLHSQNRPSPAQVNYGNQLPHNYRRRSYPAHQNELTRSHTRQVYNSHHNQYTQYPTQQGYNNPNQLADNQTQTVNIHWNAGYGHQSSQNHPEPTYFNHGNQRDNTTRRQSYPTHQLARYQNDTRQRYPNRNNQLPLHLSQSAYNNPNQQPDQRQSQSRTERCGAESLESSIGPGLRSSEILHYMDGFGREYAPPILQNEPETAYTRSNGHMSQQNSGLGSTHYTNQNVNTYTMSQQNSITYRIAQTDTATGIVGRRELGPLHVRTSWDGFTFNSPPRPLSPILPQPDNLGIETNRSFQTGTIVHADPGTHNTPRTDQEPNVSYSARDCNNGNSSHNSFQPVSQADSVPQNQQEPDVLNAESVRPCMSSTHVNFDSPNVRESIQQSTDQSCDPRQMNILYKDCASGNQAAASTVVVHECERKKYPIPGASAINQNSGRQNLRVSEATNDADMNKKEINQLQTNIAPHGATQEDDAFNADSITYTVYESCSDNSASVDVYGSASVDSTTDDVYGSARADSAEDEVFGSISITSTSFDVSLLPIAESTPRAIYEPISDDSPQCAVLGSRSGDSSSVVCEPQSVQSKAENVNELHNVRGTTSDELCCSPSAGTPHDIHESRRAEGETHTAHESRGAEGETQNVHESRGAEGKTQNVHESRGADGVTHNVHESRGADGVTQNVLESRGADGVTQNVLESRGADGVTHNVLESRGAEGVTQNVHESRGADGVTQNVHESRGADGVTHNVLESRGAEGVTQNVHESRGADGVTQNVHESRGAEGVTHNAHESRGADGVTQNVHESRGAEGVTHTAHESRGADGVTQNVHESRGADGVTHNVLESRGADGVTQNVHESRGAEGVTHTAHESRGAEYVTHEVHELIGAEGTAYKVHEPRAVEVITHVYGSRSAEETPHDSSESKGVPHVFESGRSSEGASLVYKSRRSNSTTHNVDGPRSTESNLVEQEYDHQHDIFTVLNTTSHISPELEELEPSIEQIADTSLEGLGDLFDAISTSDSLPTNQPVDDGTSALQCSLQQSQNVQDHAQTLESNSTQFRHGVDDASQTFNFQLRFPQQQTGAPQEYSNQQQDLQSAQLPQRNINHFASRSDETLHNQQRQRRRARQRRLPAVATRTTPQVYQRSQSHTRQTRTYEYNIPMADNRTPPGREWVNFSSTDWRLQRPVAQTYQPVTTPRVPVHRRNQLQDLPGPVMHNARPVYPGAVPVAFVRFSHSNNSSWLDISPVYDTGVPQIAVNPMRFIDANTLIRPDWRPPSRVVFEQTPTSLRPPIPRSASRGQQNFRHSTPEVRVLIPTNLRPPTPEMLAQRAPNTLPPLFGNMSQPPFNVVSQPPEALALIQPNVRPPSPEFMSLMRPPHSATGEPNFVLETQASGLQLIQPISFVVGDEIPFMQESQSSTIEVPEEVTGQNQD